MEDKPFSISYQNRVFKFNFVPHSTCYLPQAPLLLVDFIELKTFKQNIFGSFIIF